jgi:hypothetical protein
MYILENSTHSRVKRGPVLSVVLERAEVVLAVRVVVRREGVEPKTDA